MSSTTALLTFTDENFQSEVLESPIPVLVDFSAVWCGPCKALAPIIEELAREYAGRVKIGKLDIDDDRETPGRVDIMAVPTLVFFKGGRERARLQGGRSKSVIKEHLDALLASA